MPTVLVSPQPCMNPVSEKFDVCCNKVESAAALIPGAGGLPATQGLATLARQVGRQLKVHKSENFFGSDFEFCTISLLVMLKY